MVLKVSITKEQADVLVKSATGLGMDTMRTMNVQDLIRFWIDQGCPLEPVAGLTSPPTPKTASAVVASAAVGAIPKKALRAEPPAASGNAGGAGAEVQWRLLANGATAMRGGDEAWDEESEQWREITKALVGRPVGSARVRRIMEDVS